MTEWSVLDVPRWIGLKNYEELVVFDNLFLTALVNTAYYVFVSVPLGVLLSIVTALLMNQKVRGIAIFRTIYYLPSVTSGVAVAILWIWLLNPEVGLVNTFLRLLGLPGPGWLLDPAWAMPALILMSLWCCWPASRGFRITFTRRRRLMGQTGGRSFATLPSRCSHRRSSSS